MAGQSALRYASKKDWGALTKDLRVIYTAVDEQAAETALDAFAERWSARYPTIVRLWRSHWAEFVPFLAFPPEVRRVIYTTNLIESINARLRKVTRNRGQFPTEQVGAESALPRGAESRGISRGDRRDPQFRLETSATSVHHLL